MNFKTKHTQHKSKHKTNTKQTRQQSKRNSNIQTQTQAKAHSKEQQKQKQSNIKESSLYKQSPFISTCCGPHGLTSLKNIYMNIYI